jgi:hypothetical protein
MILPLGTIYPIICSVMGLQTAYLFVRKVELTPWGGLENLRDVPLVGQTIHTLWIRESWSKGLQENKGM